MWPCNPSWYPVQTGPPWHKFPVRECFGILSASGLWEHLSPPATLHCGSLSHSAFQEHFFLRVWLHSSVIASQALEFLPRTVQAGRYHGGESIVLVSSAQGSRETECN